MSQELPLKIDANDLSTSSPYQVNNRAEIVHNLRQLAKKPELVCIYPAGSEMFALSAVLDVDVDARLLYLDMPADEQMLARILSSDQLLCASAFNRVKIQFPIHRVSVAAYQDRPALLTPLPSEMIRLQRREYYRLLLPLARPLTCLIPNIDGDVVEVGLVDISLGGVGILGYNPDIVLEPGRIYHGCRIELPEIGTILTDLLIKNVFDVTLRNGIRTRRSGCEFLHMPGTMQTLIQRYISKIERERLALE